MVIATSCGRESVINTHNPLLESWDTPFGIAPFERIEAEHYLEAFDLAFEEQRAEVERITSDHATPTFEGVVWALDNSDIRLRELKDLFEMSEAAISDENYQRVSEIVMPRIAAAYDAVAMNRELFAKIKDVYLRRGELELDPQQMRFVEKIYTKFVRGGANLTDTQMSELSAINEEIARLSSRFSRNLLIENDGFVLNLGPADIKGMPNTLRQPAKAEAERRGESGRWIFTLNPASMMPLLSGSDDRAMREKIYKAYLNRGSNGGDSDNRELVVRITQLRQQRAKLLGYSSHAEYVISQQMAGSPSQAYSLLNKIWTPALLAAKREREELQKLLEKDHPEATLESWDWWYYTEKLRNERFRLTDDALSPYFSLERVRGGAFTLANRLYGLTFRPIQAPSYHPDCVAYEVEDREFNHLGVLYFDLYTRSGKGLGAWCGNLREQRTDGGDRITPVVAIVCNFPRPVGATPSLLTLEQVETLFHEFGHSLHFLFQNVDYHGLAAVEGDFVEFPSQVMENWALDPQMLKMYAVHHRTGQAMPDWMVEKISESRSFNQGFETLSLTAAALLDLDLQSTTDFEEFDLAQFEQEALRERRGMIPQIEPRYHIPYFSHLFTYDYSAGYYFYLWAEVLDKDCFEAFRSTGDIFSKRMADKLRDEILRRGGEEDGMTLYHNFRGEAPSQEPMLKARGLLQIDKK